MSEFLGIDIKTLDDGGFQFCQTELIHKVLETTGMDNCNGLSTPTRDDAPLGTDANGYEANRDWTNSYASFIRMMLYHPFLFTSVTGLHTTPRHHTR